MCRIVILSLLGWIIISCSVPLSSVQQSKNLQSSDDTMPSPPAIYYHGYKEICNTVWETKDKKLKVVFGAQEKNIHIIFENKQYPINSTTCEYNDGIFLMESQVQNASTNHPWSLVLSMRPDSRTEAWYTLYSGGPIDEITGILFRIQ